MASSAICIGSGRGVGAGWKTLTQHKTPRDNRQTRFTKDHIFPPMSIPAPREHGPGGRGRRLSADSVAGIRAAQLGMSVATIEERYWGGVCLNTLYAFHQKPLLRNAEIASILTHQADEFGIPGVISISTICRAVSRSREVADAWVRGVHFLMRKNKITEIDGRGRFSGSPHTQRTVVDGGTTKLRFHMTTMGTG